MENCLITKLKDVVQNDNLPKLNVLSLKAKRVVTSNFQRLNSRMAIGTSNRGPITVTVDGEGYFVLDFANINDPGSKLTTITIPAGVSQYILFFGNGDYNISINGKYNISRFDLYSELQETVVKATLEDLSFLPDLETIEFAYNTRATSGSVDALKYSQNLNVLNFSGNPNISGNLSSIKSNLFNVLYLSSTNVVGTVEEFVAAQIALGRESPYTDSTAYRINLLNGGITFGSHIYDLAPATGSMTWDGLTRIFCGIGDSTGLLSCSTIYAKGATAEEIAAWEAAGKTVVVVN